MLFAKLRKKADRGPAAKAMWPRRAAFRRITFRPRVDEMEFRTLLSAWTVTSPADAGAGSLRQAIHDAADGDTINFDGSLAGTPIVLASELPIDKSLDIEGLGSDLSTIDGGAAGRVFDIITPGVNVTLVRMTITGGVAAEGGGILDQGGNLTVVAGRITGNQAIGAAGADGSDGLGGGIAVEGGSLTVVDSTIASNLAQGGAGGAGVAGANHTGAGQGVGGAGGAGGDGGRGLGGGI
jgi:hypothetical protein